MSVLSALNPLDPCQSHKFLLLLCVVLSFFKKKEEEEKVKEEKVKESNVSVYFADNSKFKRMICVI